MFDAFVIMFPTLRVVFRNFIIMCDDCFSVYNMCDDCFSVYNMSALVC